MKRALLGLLLLGCVDPQPRADYEPETFDFDLPPESDARVVGPERDAEPDAPDLAVPPDAGLKLDGEVKRDAGRDAGPRPDVGPVECALEVERVPTDGFDLVEPFVAGREVLIHRFNDEGRLRAVRARDGSPVGGPEDLLIDARGAARLLARPDGAGNRRVIYRDADGDRPLAAAATLAPDLFQVPGRRRQVGPKQAAWIEQGSVARWFDDDILFLSRGNLAHPQIQDGRVLWLDLTRRTWQFADRDGTVSRSTTFEHTPPVFVDDHVWWLDPDGVPSRRAPGGRVERFEVAFGCTALDAEADVAAVVCPSGVGNAVFRLRPDTEPELVDNAPYIRSVRLHRGELAWARYPEPNAWCNGSEGGVLLWWPRGEDAPLEVAPITAGCDCCGALWPALVIDLGDDTLAWNYAGPRGEAEVGIARRNCFD